MMVIPGMCLRVDVYLYIGIQLHLLSYMYVESGQAVQASCDVVHSTINDVSILDSIRI